MFILRLEITQMIRWILKNLQKKLIIYLFGNSALQEPGIIEILESLPFTLKETICDALGVTAEYVAKIREEIKAWK